MVAPACHLLRLGLLLLLLLRLLLLLLLLVLFLLLSELLEKPVRLCFNSLIARLLQLSHDRLPALLCVSYCS